MEGRLSRRIFWGVLGIALSLPGLASADSVNSEWSSSTRVRSMGNIGIASADDPTTATFFNPAGFARLKAPTIEAFNLQLDLGGGIFTDARTPADYGAVGSFGKSLPLLRANPGTPLGARLSLSPSFTAQNFGFSLLAQVDGASYYDSGSKAFFYHSRKMLIPSLGMAIGTLGGRFRAGFSVRAIELNETNLTTPDTGSALPLVSNPRNGFGVGLDAGVLLTMPWSGLPTIGAVARNIGGTAFPAPPPIPLGGTTVLRHERLPMTYDGGFSLAPKMGRDQLTWAVDYRDVLNRTGASFVRHLNSGLEYGIKKTLLFRAGFSQGYWTAGFGISAKTGSIDLGTYGEELTDTAYHGAGDRRYSLRLTRKF